MASGDYRTAVTDLQASVQLEPSRAAFQFAYAYARAKDAQESLLVEGGMTGVYEPRFAVFAAKNLAGWKDQVETVSEVTHTLASTENVNPRRRIV